MSDKRVIPYASPKPATKWISPLGWWLLVDVAIMLGNIVFIFAIEPEHALQPPASPVAERIATAMFFVWFGLFIGIAGWWIRDLHRRRSTS